MLAMRSPPPGDLLGGNRLLVKGAADVIHHGADPLCTGLDAGDRLAGLMGQLDAPVDAGHTAFHFVRCTPCAGLHLVDYRSDGAGRRSASFLTSSATTAKPRPCSPAHAASMAAFSASRLIWSATSRMTLMTEDISFE